MSHETLLQQSDSALVVVDMQEKLLPVIDGAETVERAADILVQAAGMLDVPVVVTEQYPRGLGSTVPSLTARLGETTCIEKMSFSCVACDAFLDAVEDLGVDQIVLCGIETHVCVLQTALDLVDQGFQVHVAADAVGSRHPDNHRLALARLARQGVVVTCTESILFEWLHVAGTEAFKAVSKLIR